MSKYGVISSPYLDTFHAVWVSLKRLRYSYLNNVVFSYLNINSIRNKFGDLNKIVDGNIDILCIEETKLDESFLNNQFVYQCNNQFMYAGYYRQ